MFPSIVKVIAIVFLAGSSSIINIHAQAQQTSASLSGCHSHGEVQYCYLPNGEETAVSTAGPTSTAGGDGDGDGGGGASTTPAAADAQTTAVTDCHMHGASQFCIKGDGEEVMAQVTGTRGLERPSPSAQYTACHSHGEDELYCYGPDEEETPFVAEGAAAGAVETAAPESTGEEPGEENCHFHAGVEHCVGAGESEGESGDEPAAACDRIDRDYNIGLRVGTLFAILATSSIAVFGPILLTRFTRVKSGNTIFTILKQFGTGVIISTAFVHLLTHAEIMFTNECLGELAYEGTTTAIAVAGAFLAFFLQYIALRVQQARATSVTSSRTHAEQLDREGDKLEPRPNRIMDHHGGFVNPDDKLSVLILEMGVIFHSIIIGVTLVVAGDSFFVVLFVVVMFHQMFEGLALGVRISTLRTASLSLKLLMGSAYALITPIGMAIGIGVLHQFNGNDPGTIVAIGTLDAFSAGILIWAGFVEMWSFDWLYGELRDAGPVKTVVAMTAFVGGLVLMSLLGKWA